MAGKMTVTGLDSLADMLENLGASAEGIASSALYNGAGVMADAMSQAVNSIRTAPFRYARGGEKRLPSPEEVEAIRGHNGIARFEGSGSELYTVIGFQSAGYTDIRGRRKTYRRAVGQIANSINSGTSFMEKQPVFRRAVRSAKGPASQAIVDTAERMINEITK